VNPTTRFAILFLLVQAVALIWPVATWINDPTIRILGLPLPFAWSVGWIVLTFGVMGLVWMSDRGTRNDTADS